LVSKGGRNISRKARPPNEATIPIEPKVFDNIEGISGERANWRAGFG
jgi:hypothetical protein